MKKINLLKTVLERRGYCQSQVDPCVLYRKDSVILTHVYDFLIVSHKQETIALLIESLKNVPENYVLTDEVDISNYLGVNIKKNLDGAFELLQSQLVEKIINHVGFTVLASIKARETPSGKSLLHKEKSSLGMNSICNSREAVGMLIFVRGSTRP